ncbi:MAG: phospholipase D-like domain-containing protein [Candidatus Bathyarchaeia archaeon]|jgi:hypothetical protein
MNQEEFPSKYWEEFRSKLEVANNGLGKFNVVFMDDQRFSNFINHLKGNKTEYDYQYSVRQCNFFDIIGYFSEGIGKVLLQHLEGYKDCKIRLITPELKTDQRQDRLNLNALRKMQEKGIEIRVNDRIHTRLFIGYSDRDLNTDSNGVLLLGTFDFNKEGLSEDKINAGILTRHPDLVKSARELFERVWEEKIDTKPLNEAYPLKTNVL